MQAPRGAQPSCTNRPSSSSPTLRSRGRATFCPRTRCAVRPPGHRAEPGPLQPNAPRWSATMAGEVHPVPFRTRKLSPLAPMVLRSSPWESRTSLTNEGHLRAGRAPSPAWWRGPLAFRGTLVVCGNVLSQRLLLSSRCNPSFQGAILCYLSDPICFTLKCVEARAICSGPLFVLAR